MLASVSRFNTGAGVPAGATTPNHARGVNSGILLSAKVGTSGNSGER